MYHSERCQHAHYVWNGPMKNRHIQLSKNKSTTDPASVPLSCANYLSEFCWQPGYGDPRCRCIPGRHHCHASDDQRSSVKLETCPLCIEWQWAQITTRQVCVLRERGLLPGWRRFKRCLASIWWEGWGDRPVPASRRRQATLRVSSEKLTTMASSFPRSRLSALH